MKYTSLSAYEETSGLIHFARMTDKIRKNANGELREDFTDNLGKGFDLWLCEFLKVSYDELKAKVLEGLSNEDALQWCYANGRELDESDIRVFNGWLSKLGWNDPISQTLERRKREANLADADAIQTMIEFFEYDEGRKTI